MPKEREVDAEVIEEKPRKRKKSSREEETITIDDIYEVLSDISDGLVEIGGEDGVGDQIAGELARIADCLEVIIQAGTSVSPAGNLISAAGEVISRAFKHRQTARHSGRNNG